jgi:hypothetical protein
MQIKRLINDEGSFRCFEFENKQVSRSGTARIIAQLHGVEVLHEPRFYDDEIFCEFAFMGKVFKASEPYGDSSVYDISGPENSDKELELIAHHFETTPGIKGGDTARNAFFLANWLVVSALLLFVISLLYRAFRWIVS